MDLQVGEGQREMQRADIRPVGQPRILELGLCPEAQPSKTTKEVPDLRVAVRAKAAVARARVSVCTFGIIAIVSTATGGWGGGATCRMGICSAKEDATSRSAPVRCTPHPRSSGRAR